VTRESRTPFSPERTVVPLPDTNPEEEESLAGALERQGATIIIIIIIKHTQRHVFHDIFHADFTNSTRCSVM